MKRGIVVGLAVVVVGLVAMLLTGCVSEDNAAARRANAESALVTAQGQAYAERVRADAAASAERASVRQMERDAAAARMVGLLPYILVVAGLVLIGGLAAWALAFRSVATGRDDGRERALLEYVRRLELQQAERDREFWRVLAQVCRRELSDGRGRDVDIVRRD